MSSPNDTPNKSPAPGFPFNLGDRIHALKGKNIKVKKLVKKDDGSFTLRETLLLNQTKDSMLDSNLLRNSEQEFSAEPPQARPIKNTPIEGFDQLGENAFKKQKMEELELTTPRFRFSQPREAAGNQILSQSVNAKESKLSDNSNDKPDVQNKKPENNTTPEQTASLPSQRKNIQARVSESPLNLAQSTEQAKMPKKSFSHFGSNASPYPGAMSNSFDPNVFRLPPKASALLAREQELKNSFSQKMTEQKQRVEQNFSDLQREFQGVIEEFKRLYSARFDAYNENFGKNFELFKRKCEEYKTTDTWIYGDPKPDSPAEIVLKAVKFIEVEKNEILLEERSETKISTSNLQKILQRKLISFLTDKLEEKFREPPLFNSTSVSAKNMDSLRESVFGNLSQQLSRPQNFIWVPRHPSLSKISLHWEADVVTQEKGKQKPPNVIHLQEQKLIESQKILDKEFNENEGLGRELFGNQGKVDANLESVRSIPTTFFETLASDSKNIPDQKLSIETQINLGDENRQPRNYESKIKAQSTEKNEIQAKVNLNNTDLQSQKDADFDNLVRGFANRQEHRVIAEVHCRGADIGGRTIRGLAEFNETYIAFGDEFYLVFDNETKKIRFFQLKQQKIFYVAFLKTKKEILNKLGFENQLEFETDNFQLVLIATQNLENSSSEIIVGHFSKFTLSVLTTLSLPSPIQINSLIPLKDGSSFLMIADKNLLVLHSIFSPEAVKEYNAFAKKEAQIISSCALFDQEFIAVYTNDGSINFFEVQYANSGEGGASEMRAVGVSRVLIVSSQSAILAMWPNGGLRLDCSDSNGNLLDIELQKIDGKLNSQIKLLNVFDKGIDKFFVQRLRDSAFGKGFLVFVSASEKVMGVYNFETKKAFKCDCAEILKEQGLEEQSILIREFNGTAVEIYVATGDAIKKIVIE